MVRAVREENILFYGAWEGDSLVGCCSVTVGFSTFDYLPSGVFEDFFIRPDFRHKGVARQLVQFAYRASAVSSMTVGCADCDVPMYQALGFSIPLGNLLAFEEASQFFSIYGTGSAAEQLSRFFYHFSVLSASVSFFLGRVSQLARAVRFAIARSSCARASVSCPGVRRQRQLKPTVPGWFIRASLPSPK